MDTSALQRALLIGIAVLAVASRLYQFAAVPPGLNQDEASIGYEAFSLLYYGIDRNGMSYPVHLVSWGSGQNALYAYLAMPFVALGLNQFTVRLPMVLTALLSLPLAWWVVRRAFGERAALAAVTTLALSPWHIMLSRWALESNLLPFVFVAGFACLLKSFEVEARRRIAWMAAAGVLFGLCTYAYGAAYLALPLFLIGAMGVGLVSRTIGWKAVIVGLVAFAAVSAPIVAFIAVNTFRWDSIVIAGVSIPRLPVTPRFQSQLPPGSGGLMQNAQRLASLLTHQGDGTVYNITAPFGFVYSFAFLALGLLCLAVLAVQFVATRGHPERMLFVIWFLACLATGIVQEANINRINLLLVPSILGAGIALAMIDEKLRGALAAGLVVYLACFALFVSAYFTSQREKIALEFFDGLLPALSYVQQQTDHRICVTRQVNMPYVYALFAERTDPREFLRTVEYENPNAPFRFVARFGRYTFGLDRCDYANTAAVVARRGETLPAGVPIKQRASFGFFDTYVLR